MYLLFIHDHYDILYGLFYSLLIIGFLVHFLFINYIWRINSLSHFILTVQSIININLSLSFLSHYHLYFLLIFVE